MPDLCKPLADRYQGAASRRRHKIVRRLAGWASLRVARWQISWWSSQRYFQLGGAHSALAAVLYI